MDTGLCGGATMATMKIVTHNEGATDAVIAELGGTVDGEGNFVLSVDQAGAGGALTLSVLGSILSELKITNKHLAAMSDEVLLCEEDGDLL